MSISILVLIFLLIISFLVSGTETAYFSLKEKDILTFEKERKFFFKLFNSPERFLVIILILNNIANSFASAIFASITLSIFEKGSKFLIDVIDTIVFSVILLIFAEITPKTMALMQPRKFASYVTPVFKVFYSIFERIFFPFIILFQTFRKFLAGKKKKVDFTGELIRIVGTIERAKGFEKDEKFFIEKVIEMRKMTAKSIMVPYEKVNKIPYNKKISQLLKEEIPYSHMPVIHNDKIAGIVKIWNLLKEDNRDKKVSDVISPFSCYDENISVADIFLKMVKNKEEFVILKNNGNYTGCVTLADIFNLFLRTSP